MSDETPTCTPEQKEELERELKQMDWYYHMSDDPKAHSKGMTREIELRNKAIRLGLYSLFRHYRERT